MHIKIVFLHQIYEIWTIEEAFSQMSSILRGEIKSILIYSFINQKVKFSSWLLLEKSFVIVKLKNFSCEVSSTKDIYLWTKSNL